jgi:cell division protein FtsW
MERSFRPDSGLLIVLVLLVVVGILLLVSTSFSLSREEFGSATYMLFHQLKFGFLPGVLLGGACFLAPLEKIKKFAPIALIFSIFFMILVFLPFSGVSLGGASRWVSLGPVSFQPSEFLKITFIVYLAAWISNRASKVSSLRKSFGKKAYFWKLEDVEELFLPFLIIIGLVGTLLILQPDISTLGIIVITAFFMYFAANTNFLHSVFLVCGGIAGLAALIVLAPYRMSRILTFLKMGADPMGASYQINQSLIAIGSGGLWGKGLAMGSQKFGFLPQSISDSIFAIFSEETGFVGSVILVLLFLAFAAAGIRIAKKAPDTFSRILALGITLWIASQAFVNIGAIIGIMPLTGIPLPFISYGGSHLTAELIGAGIILNISRNS